jgi:flagellar FliL protein
MAKNDAQVQADNDVKGKGKANGNPKAEMSSEATDEQAKKRPIKLFIIIAVLIVLASASGAYFMLFGNEAESNDVVAEVVEPKAIYFALNPKFKTNYEVDGRPRLFQIGITLVTREQDVIDALMTHGPSIKSRLVILLSGQQAENLQTPEGRESLRAECLSAVQEIMNKEMGKPGIEKVLFTDFVMQ